MANLVFDVGCIPTPLDVTVEHPSERETHEDGFVAGRKYAEVEFHSVRMRFTDVSPEVWDATLSHWSLTFGGTLLMDWTPPDGGPLRQVRFAREPKLEQRGARKVTFSVELEDAP